MSNVLLEWVNSTPGPKQRPLAHTVLEARTDPSLAWGEVAVVDVPETERLLADLAPGTWEFRATEVDDAGQPSANQPTASIDLPFDPPSGVAVFTATLA